MTGAERTMRERMLAGEPYVVDESLAADARRCRLLLHRINTATPDQDDERDACLRELLGSFGEGSNIRPPFHCDYGFQLHSASASSPTSASSALDVARITIGDDTQIGSGVQLLTPTHPLEPDRRRDGLGGRRADHHRPQRLARRRASWSAPASPSATTPSSVPARSSSAISPRGSSPSATRRGWCRSLRH